MSLTILNISFAKLHFSGNQYKKLVDYFIKYLNLTILKSSTKNK